MRSFSKVFFYVGAPAIIATMWQVESEATKIIMEYLYDNLRKGLAVANSLKKAQCDFLTNNPAYAHPYYFSPFVCLGNPF
jgi:CHAT domain-containing protein